MAKTETIQAFRNTKNIGTLSYSTSQYADRQAVMEQAFNDITVTNEAFIGNLGYAGQALIIGYKYAGGQYGMMLAWWYNSMGSINCMNVIEGSKYHRKLDLSAI